MMAINERPAVDAQLAARHLLSPDAPYDGSGHLRAVAAQFALTALYHFLFVTLTLGLSLLLGVIETLYVMTGRRIWRAYDAVLGFDPRGPSIRPCQGSATFVRIGKERIESGTVA